ncbi:MAG TPA: HAD family hydrolase [Xanthobacteraceae bacterium]|nr:HAD family hydrolase [Xanthobacteraceae bacterium]
MCPALIIFDCDGVLIDSEVISARALIAELANHGVDVDRAYVARHFLGRSYPLVRTVVRERLGVHLPDAFEEAYRSRLLAAYQDELQVMAGAAETVEALRVPYCVATSSSPPRLARSLEITGLAPLFAGRGFTASEVARGKPAPDLFLHAAARMGTEPARCTVIEDSPIGLEAGIAAGMQVWHFTGGSHLAGAELDLPDHVRPARSFASFMEIRAAVPELFDTHAGYAVTA